MNTYIKHFVNRKPIHSVVSVLQYNSKTSEETLNLIKRYALSDPDKKVAFDFIILCEKVLHRMMIDNLDYYNLDESSKTELRINASILSLAESQNLFEGMNYSAIKAVYEEKVEKWNEEYPECPRFKNESLLMKDSPVVMSSEKLKQYFQNEVNTELTPLIKSILNDRSEGLLLKEIGDKYGFSLEWIRQLETRGKEVIQKFLYRTQSSLMDIAKKEEKELITFNNLTVVFKKRGAVQLDYVINQQDSLLNPTIKPLINIRLYTNQEQSIETYRQQYESIGVKLIKDRIGLYNKDETLSNDILTYYHENGYPITINDAEVLKESYVEKFKLKSDFLQNKTITRKQMFEKIQEHYFPMGVDPQDVNDLNKFYDILTNEYGVRYKASKTVGVKIINHLYLIDSSLYGREALFQMDDQLFNEILSYIKEYTAVKLLYRDLYDVFEAQLIENSTITNPEMLHGYLHIRKDDLDGIKLNKGSLLKEDAPIKIDNALEYYFIIANELAKQPMSYTMDEVAKLMNDEGLNNDATRVYLMNNVPELVSWGNKRLFNLKSVSLTKEQKEMISLLIRQATKNSYHYTSIYQILDTVKGIFGEELAKITEKPRHVYNIIEFHCQEVLESVLLAYPHIIVKNKWNKDTMTTVDFIQMILGRNPHATDEEIRDIMTELYGKKDSQQYYRMQKIRAGH